MDFVVQKQYYVDAQHFTGQPTLQPIRNMWETCETLKLKFQMFLNSYIFV